MAVKTHFFIFSESNDCKLEEDETTDEPLFSNESVNSVEKTLGIHYKGLFAFFCKYFFRQKDDTYTILIARRCLVLAMWFFRFIQESFVETINEHFQITEQNGVISIINNETGKQNVIVGDGFLDSGYQFDYKYQFNIIDDICIHGRQINTIKEKIISLFASERISFCKDNIKIIVYTQNEENQIKNINEYWISAYGSTWKNLSNSIVDCINLLNLPYVSYLNSYSRAGISLEEFNALKDKFKKTKNLYTFEFGSTRQTNLGKRSLFVIEKELELFKNEKAKFCRIYYNSISQSLTVIPYVILDGIQEEDIDFYLCDNAGGELSAILDKSKTSHKYKLINTLASNLYGKYFMDKYLNSSVPWYLDQYNILSMTYGTKISKLVCDFSNYKHYEDLKPTSNGKISESDADEIEKLRSEKKLTLEKVLSRQWIINEVNACYLLDKEPKLNLDQYIFDKDNDLIVSALLNIIRLCDTGVACLFIESNEKCSRNCLDVGEQGVNLMVKKDLFGTKEEKLIQALRQASPYYRNTFS